MKNMDQGTVRRKMMELMKPCGCGSGKMLFACCGKGEAKEIENETCPCGSGKKVKDCCMKNPEAHA